MRHFLIPVPARVLDPQTMRPLPPAGAWVDIASSGAHGTYWRRRIAEGDVTISGREVEPLASPVMPTADVASKATAPISTSTRRARARNS